MTGQHAIKMIQGGLASVNDIARVPLFKQVDGRTDFTATRRDDGVEVSNLHLQPFLPWAVFETAVELLVENDGRAEKGSAQAGKLGEDGLSLDSIEGRVASKVYGAKLGDSVFRRITPIACILVWAGVCENGRGELILDRKSVV